MGTRILITDDADTDRSRLNDRLVKAGYEVLQANNGAVHDQPVGAAIDTALKQVDDCTNQTDDDISTLGLRVPRAQRGLAEFAGCAMIAACRVFAVFSFCWPHSSSPPAASHGV